MRQSRVISLFSALWITWTSICSAAQPKKVNFDFYGHAIDVIYASEFVPAYTSFSQEAPGQFVKTVPAAAYKAIADQLLKDQKELQLNDWLYYQLVKKTTQQLFPSVSPAYRTMSEWYILSQSGYKVRLMYDQKRPYVFVNTPDELLDVPFFLTHEGRFINISVINTADEKSLQKLTAYEPKEGIKGRPFVFSFTVKPPLFAEQEMERVLHFDHAGTVYTLPVKGDKTYISFLRSYPKLDLSHLPSVPVSDITYESVIPTFRTWISGMDEAQAVRLILSFTRSAFAYESDKIAFHDESLALSPEMTLLSPYSDCEDRAILFAWMVKELLGKEVVLLEFPTHVAAAVNLTETYGSPITVDGKQYSFCEATGPQNDLEVGQCDKRYVRVGFKVLRLD
jgi:hypothetical protein